MVSQGAGFVIALADACDPGSGYPPRSPGLQTGTLYSYRIVPYSYHGAGRNLKVRKKKAAEKGLLIRTNEG